MWASRVRCGFDALGGRGCIEEGWQLIVNLSVVLCSLRLVCMIVRVSLVFARLNDRLTGCVGPLSIILYRFLCRKINDEGSDDL